jgi:hypothetical protein
VTTQIIGLEMNAEKTKYTLLSHHHNPGQDIDMKRPKELFENTKIFKLWEWQYQILFWRQLRGDCVRFKVFTAVTMKNGVFWDVTPCGSYKNHKSHTA